MLKNIHILSPHNKSILEVNINPEVIYCWLSQNEEAKDQTQVMNTKDHIASSGKTEVKQLQFKTLQWEWRQKQHEGC